MEDLARGMMVATPGMFAATQSVDVQLRLLSAAPRTLKDRAKIHFHAHAMEAVGETVFQRSLHLNPKGSQASPGSEAFVRIRLPEPRR